MSCGKFVSLGCPVSCGKFLFPSPYLPIPILDVPSPVVNSSSHLPTWQFRPCGKFFSHLPTCQFPPAGVHVLSLPASSGLGSPIPALEVPCHVVNSPSHLPTCLRQIPLPVSLAASSPSSACQFPPWMSHLLILDVPSPG